MRGARDDRMTTDERQARMTTDERQARRATKEGKARRTVDERWARMLFRTGNGLAAIALSVGLLAVCQLGTGAVPALGRLLVPGHGAWEAAACRLMPGLPDVPLADIARSPGGRALWSPEVAPACGAATAATGWLP